MCYSRLSFNPYISYEVLAQANIQILIARPVPVYSLVNKITDSIMKQQSDNRIILYRLYTLDYDMI